MSVSHKPDVNGYYCLALRNITHRSGLKVNKPRFGSIASIRRRTPNRNTTRGRKRKTICIDGRISARNINNGLQLFDIRNSPTISRLVQRQRPRVCCCRACAAAAGLSHKTFFPCQARCAVRYSAVAVVCKVSPTGSSCMIGCEYTGNSQQKDKRSHVSPPCAIVAGLAILHNQLITTGD